MPLGERTRWRLGEVPPPRPRRVGEPKLGPLLRPPGERAGDAGWTPPVLPKPVSTLRPTIRDCRARSSETTDLQGSSVARATEQREWRCVSERQ